MSYCAPPLFGSLMKKERSDDMYLYYAIFSLEDDAVNVVFPDLEGAATFGEDMHEALYMAKDLLAGWLLGEVDDGMAFPNVTDPREIQTEPGELVIPIEVDLDFYRKKFDSTPIKKTLTIPSYLNDLGIKASINFSATLTDALKEKLGV
ncbi:type II toxin-antitoxin system HicB family antitoxin [Enterococcus sp.]|uniref:type II toxin-antitoxin system HicB family antitoxin n=1 Tax=Enterococcus sp. TaxID=35783 RepID=UPI00289ADB4B|nr:type II toxin-antitoxin system HicB family antitoxin [Enterococcus sp.]